MGVGDGKRWLTCFWMVLCLPFMAGIILLRSFLGCVGAFCRYPRFLAILALAGGTFVIFFERY